MKNLSKINKKLIFGSYNENYYLLILLFMNEFQVTCINKIPRFSSHEHIKFIGNTDGKWKIWRDDAINRIESGKEKFYTVDRMSGQKAYIGVVRESGKLPYLRTYADGKWNDNLLSLNECGDDCKIL